MIYLPILVCHCDLRIGRKNALAGPLAECRIAIWSGAEVVDVIGQRVAIALGEHEAASADDMRDLAGATADDGDATGHGLD